MLAPCILWRGVLEQSIGVESNFGVAKVEWSATALHSNFATPKSDSTPLHSTPILRPNTPHQYSAPRLHSIEYTVPLMLLSPGLKLSFSTCMRRYLLGLMLLCLTRTFYLLPKSANPEPVLLLRSPVWFCPYCSMLLCDIQKQTTGEDATTVVVLFCRQSHLGCTDMSLQQNRNKNA